MIEVTTYGAADSQGVISVHTQARPSSDALLLLPTFLVHLMQMPPSSYRAACRPCQPWSRWSYLMWAYSPRWTSAPTGYGGD